MNKIFLNILTLKEFEELNDVNLSCFTGPEP